MGRGLSLRYLPPLVKSSVFLGRVGWEVLGDQWHDMAFCGMTWYLVSHKNTTQWVVERYLGLESSISQNIRNIFRMGIFLEKI